MRRLLLALVIALVPFGARAALAIASSCAAIRGSNGADVSCTPSSIPEGALVLAFGTAAPGCATTGTMAASGLGTFTDRGNYDYSGYEGCIEVFTDVAGATGSESITYTATNSTGRPTITVIVLTGADTTNLSGVSGSNYEWQTPSITHTAAAAPSLVFAVFRGASVGVSSNITASAGTTEMYEVTGTAAHPWAWVARTTNATGLPGNVTITGTGQTDDMVRAAFEVRAAGITILQHTEPTCLAEGDTDRVFTYGASTAASGSFLIASVSGSSGFSITDNKGNGTWRSNASLYVEPGGEHASLRWIENATGGASHSITVAGVGAWSSVCVDLMEFSGVMTSGNPFDQYDVETGYQITASGSTPTTTQADELLIGVVKSGNQAVTYTQGSGWTMVGQVDAALSMGTQYRVVSATGTYSSSFGISPAGGNFGHIIATFKAAGAGGPQTYNESFTESATSLHTNVTACTFPQSYTETPTAADALTPGLVIARSFTETPTAVDSLTNTVIFMESLTEVVTSLATLVDELIHTGNQTYNEAFTETVAAVDALINSLVAVQGFTETTSPTDSLLVGATYVEALTEAVTAAESLVNAMTFTQSYTEVAVPVTSISTQMDMVNAFTEAANALATLVVQDGSLQGQIDELRARVQALEERLRGIGGTLRGGGTLR